MNDEPENAAHGARVRELQRTWAELCAEYLPLTDGESIWCYNRPSEADDLDQGWKLHISATILNAPQILKRIAPALIECGVQFKAARSLTDVITLNAGLHHSYSQVGKVITVYPRSNSEAVRLAQRLDRLTFRFRTPAVPFDLRFREASNVYYRYGAFKHFEIERDGRVIPAVMSAGGELVPDVRETPKPHWVSDPFQSLTRRRQVRKRKFAGASSFPVVRALVQRGKGGVYQAIDLQSNPPRPCLLKEGRRHGELDWDGRDGAWRVRNEERVLSRLSRCDVKVPKVYSRFEVAGNIYLVMEFVEGETLHNLLLRQKRRLPIRSVLAFGIELAEFLAQMHRAGWAWRDCKPTNLIVNRTGHLVPIDFEGAERIARPDPSLWGTTGFMPLVSRNRASHTGLTDDLYALGSILFLMIGGQMFDDSRPISIVKLRRNIPLELGRIVESLLAATPQERPGAQHTEAQLTSILKSLKRQRLRSAHA